MGDFDRILRHVEQQMGFATSHYDRAYLDRRIKSRMRRCRVSDYGEYLTTLRSDKQEQAALLDALSINVTGFFRNPKVWSEIRRLLRRVTERRNEVTVWSAGCSDGREPYSLAMLALDDSAINDQQLSIVATDIDESVLAEAQRGVYRDTTTTDIKEELAPLDEYNAYVNEADGQFEVSNAVKELVEFERHDLISDQPKSGVDFVICRNLFIYIDSDHKLPILRTVRQSLREDSYLVIGKTETIPEPLRPSFNPVDQRLRIYQLAD